MKSKMAEERLSRLLHGENISWKLISPFECFELAAEFPFSQSSSQEFYERHLKQSWMSGCCRRRMKGKYFLSRFKLFEDIHSSASPTDMGRSSSAGSSCSRWKNNENWYLIKLFDNKFYFNEQCNFPDKLAKLSISLCVSPKQHHPLNSISLEIGCNSESFVKDFTIYVHL